MPIEPLLYDLLAIPAISSDESLFAAYLRDYVLKRGTEWKVTPEIHFSKNLHDNLILSFGDPQIGVFAHMDTVGFMARYENQLLPIGGPEVENGDILVGADAMGEIECRVKIEDGNCYHDFPRSIARGTLLSYKQRVEVENGIIQAAYLDNRLGIYNALKLCETLENGVVVFSCYEEHGGGSIPLLMDYLMKRWPIRAALVSDITWCSDGVISGGGVVISIRDKHIPRRTYINSVIELAAQSGIPYQLEVEAYGSSDGREIHYSPYPVDWCFIGAPGQQIHTSSEQVAVSDLEAMIALYKYLMSNL